MDAVHQLEQEMKMSVIDSLGEVMGYFDVPKNCRNIFQTYYKSKPVYLSPYEEPFSPVDRTFEVVTFHLKTWCRTVHNCWAVLDGVPFEMTDLKNMLGFVENEMYVEIEN